MFSFFQQESDGFRKPIVLSLVCGIIVSIGGCGSPASPHPVESDLARETLRTVLFSWKSGDSIESWQQNTSEIVVQDMDWLSGTRLEDFEILDDGKAVDANLHCQVRLKLSRNSDDPSEQIVTYLVTTSPKRTVFRQIIP